MKSPCRQIDFGDDEGIDFGDSGDIDFGDDAAADAGGDIDWGGIEVDDAAVTPDDAQVTSVLYRHEVMLAAADQLHGQIAPFPSTSGTGIVEPDQSSVCSVRSGHGWRIFETPGRCFRKFEKMSISSKRSEGFC